MNTLERTVHVLGAVLVCSLGGLSLRLENKRLKRIVSNLLVLALVVLLADAVMHLLPNAIAGFIYGTR
ncbi:MAG: hypothetical protein Q7T40_04230 [Methylobacter sp.]|nr:hypothetical protein [Methylobacter sp.]